MDEASVGEESLLISMSGVPLPIRDRRDAHKKRIAITLILISTVFERLAFYSLAINLIVTLQSTELDWDASNSTTVSVIFLGTSYISALIFAAISDAKLGFVLYTIGYLMIILIANDKTHDSICTTKPATHSSIFSEHCGPQIIGTLFFMALGVGAVQVNMAVFGAEQIQKSQVTARYFDKYYIAVNIGATIATLSIPFIQNDLNSETSSNNYFYGYLFAILMLICAVILFIIGHRYYIHIPPYDTVITKCIPVFINAFQTWRKYHNNNETRNRHRSDSNLGNRWYDQNTISHEEIITNEEGSHSFLHYARSINHGKYPDRIVSDVISLRRAIIVLLLLIPYWIIYYQIQITFPLQGQKMNIPFLNDRNKIPISWMSLGDSITIIIGIMFIILFVHKYSNVRDRIVSIKIKLVTGMILASLTMCIAGTVEIVRQKSCIADTSNSDLSIYTQLPQNICMGLSEIFATVASLEFAYLAAPRSAQSLLMSLHFSSLGISSYISKAYLSIYSTTSSNFDFSCLSLNKWLFSTYFFILAGLQIAFMIIIVLCDSKFDILRLHREHTQTQQS